MAIFDDEMNGIETRCPYSNCHGELEFIRDEDEDVINDDEEQPIGYVCKNCGEEFNSLDEIQDIAEEEH